MSEESFGKSLKLTNGDISFDSDGQIEWVEGQENARQGINILVGTHYTEDQLAPIYGFDWETIFNSELRGTDLLDLAELKLKAVLVQDDRIADVYDIKVELTTERQLNIECNIRLSDGTIITLGVGL